jgi:hypothetical protein
VKDKAGSLDQEIETLVIQDYFDQVLIPAAGANADEMELSDVQILRYYGTFNGYVVVMFNSGARHEGWKETIAETTIYYLDSRRIYVWKDGSLCVLKQAYENNFLSVENIQSIAKVQNDIAYLLMKDYV